MLFVSVQNRGDRVLPNFWLSRGSGWVPVENIPQPNGGTVKVGSSEPARGEQGQPEILWHMGELEPAAATRIVNGYIADNGYNGDPQVLSRAMEMMR